MFFWLWTSLNFVNLLIASVYFAFWRSIFWFWNLFKRKKSVNCANMNKLLLLPAMEVAEKIRRGELSSTQLVQAYIAQIHQVNEQINAVVANNFESALKQASEVDSYLQSLDKSSDEYKNLPIDKPLLGIPFTAKDNILIKGFLVTAGVPARKNIAPCDRDSECIKRLKAAGSILLAVTNVPTLCIWWETNNSIYGRTKNPYDLRRNPGGSSGGEGALIGAGGSLLGLGNDVGGSLRVPATFCGIYGLKPGPGVLPPAGVFPPINGGYLAQMSTAGPMCRYAKDLRLLLRVLAGKEIVDQLLKLDEPVELQKISVYYMEDIQQLFCENLHMLQRESVRKAVDYFDKELGMSTERVNFFWAHQALYMYIISFEVADYPSLTEAMANYEYNVNCAAEFFKFLLGRSEHTIMTIVNGFCASQLPHPPKWFKRFINAKRDKLREEIVDLLGNNGILLFPSFATPAPFHNHAVWTPFNFSYNALWNALALPVLTCPLGMGPDGLPTSVQIVCSPNCERILIQVAEKLEQAFGGWTPPK